MGCLALATDKKIFVPRMKTGLLLFLLTCQTALAGSANGYVVAGFGSRGGRLISQAAVGGEFIPGRVLGVGGEIGAVAGHNSFGTFSVNGYGHLPVRGHDRLGPFVTAGYTAAVGLWGFEGSAANFGGGLLCWFHRRLGLRLEFRGLIQPGGNGLSRVETGPGRLYTFRGGIAFR